MCRMCNVCVLPNEYTVSASKRERVNEGRIKRTRGRTRDRLMAGSIDPPHAVRTNKRDRACRYH